MAIRTRICDLLKIDVPILQAGMAGYTNAALVAAVSNAGGLGILGGIDRSPEALIAEISRIRTLTDRPFGVNLVIAEIGPDHWDACLAARPPVLSTSWGDAAPYVARARAAGCRIIHQVNTVAGADAAVRAGVDAIVAQGTEGGGHVGQVATMALVPQVVDAALGIPVVAAGGIVDGRGLAAALALGAEGVLIGTRFLATDEAPIAASWKQALLASPAERAILSDIPDIAWDVRWPGATCRVLRNRLVDDWLGREDALRDHAEEVVAAIGACRAVGAADYVPLYAGQGTGAVHSIVPAAEVVRAMAEDAEAILRHLSALV